MTSKIKAEMTFCGLLSFLLTIAPMLIFVVLGFVYGAPMQRFTLGCCVAVAIILTIINLVFKHHIRSTLWILLLGVYTCLSNIKALLIILAITTILDEFVIMPLYRHYKSLYTINKEIDKRELITDGRKQGN